MKDRSWYIDRVGVVIKDSGILKVGTVIIVNEPFETDKTCRNLWVRRQAMEENKFKTNHYQEQITLHESCVSFDEQDITVYQCVAILKQ